MFTEEDHTRNEWKSKKLKKEASAAFNHIFQSKTQTLN